MKSQEKVGNGRGKSRILFIILLIIGCVAIVIYIFIPFITFGAESNPTGNPLGGGAGYRQIFTKNSRRVNYIVYTKDEFLLALSRAKEGDVVYIPESADIDLTGVLGVRVPEGITIASNRGEKGSPGGRIFQKRLSSDPTVVGGSLGTMLYIVGDDVRITGLRIEGPDKNYTSIKSMGLGQRHGIYMYDCDNLEIDNCEIWGWSWGGVGLTLPNGGYSYIHHNNIHHCQDPGLGYGIVVSGGTTLVEGNIFDYVKNPIAAAGKVGEGYEARYNLVNHTVSLSHSFDIHPNVNPATGQTIAGSSYKIHHNTVREAKNFAVGIYGAPLDGVWIHHNKFLWKVDSDGKMYPPVMQKNGLGKVYMTKNLIGTPEVLYKEGPIYNL